MGLGFCRSIYDGLGFGLLFVAFRSSSLLAFGEKREEATRVNDGKFLSMIFKFQFFARMFVYIELSQSREGSDDEMTTTLMMGNAIEIRILIALGQKILIKQLFSDFE